MYTNIYDGLRLRIAKVRCDAEKFFMKSVLCLNRLRPGVLLALFPMNGLGHS